MLYTVHNQSKNNRAVFTANKPGGYLVPIGQKLDIEMTDDEASNAIAPGVSVIPAEDQDVSDEDTSQKVSVRKVGSKFAVFVDGKQQGEPGTKAAADKAAKALRDAADQ